MKKKNCIKKLKDNLKAIPMGKMVEQNAMDSHFLLNSSQEMRNNWKNTTLCYFKLTVEEKLWLEIVEWWISLLIVKSWKIETFQMFFIIGIVIDFIG